MFNVGLMKVSFRSPASAHEARERSLIGALILSGMLCGTLIFGLATNAHAMDEGAQMASVIEERALTIDLSKLPVWIDSEKTQSFYTTAYENVGDGIWFSSSLSMNIGYRSSMYVDGDTYTGDGGSRWGDWVYTETYFSENETLNTEYNIELRGEVRDIYHDEWGNVVFVSDSPFIGEVAVLPMSVVGQGSNKSVWRTPYSLSRGNVRSKSQDAVTDFPHSALGEPYANFFASNSQRVTVYFPIVPSTDPQSKSISTAATTKLKATRASLKALGN